MTDLITNLLICILPNDALEHETMLLPLQGEGITLGIIPQGADLALSGRKSTTNLFGVLRCVQALPLQGVIQSSNYSTSRSEGGLNVEEVGGRRESQSPETHSPRQRLGGIGDTNYRSARAKTLTWCNNIIQSSKY